MPCRVLRQIVLGVAVNYHSLTSAPVLPLPAAPAVEVPAGVTTDMMGNPNLGEPWHWQAIPLLGLLLLLLTLLLLLRQLRQHYCFCCRCISQFGMLFHATLCS